MKPTYMYVYYTFGGLKKFLVIRRLVCKLKQLGGGSVELEPVLVGGELEGSHLLSFFSFIPAFPGFGLLGRAQLLPPQAQYGVQWGRDPI